jgi:hypothetical protein
LADGNLAKETGIAAVEQANKTSAYPLGLRITSNYICGQDGTVPKPKKTGRLNLIDAIR